MKQVNIKLEESTIAELKIKAIQNGQSFQAFVNEVLTAYLGTPKPVHAPKPQPKKTEKPKAKIEPPTPKRYPADEFYGTPEPDYSKTLDELLNEEPDPTDERYYYVLRKTFMTTLYEDEDKWYDNGVLHWLVPKDCQAHYDRDNNLIPFRYTMPDSYTIKQPTAAEIKEIEKAYGKPVKIEE